MTRREMTEAWLARHAASWQVLNRAQWNYEFHEKTLVRYIEAAEMDEALVEDALEYLNSDGCIAGLSLYDQTIGADWKPVRAWYEVSNRSAGSVKAVRLYHALATDVAAQGDGPYLVEDGCAYKVSWKYYWKQSEVMEVPAGESGISYQITGLSRDPETGKYNYALEKRERVQQDVPEYVNAVTVYEERKEEQHLGVRGDESAGGKAASCGGGTLVTRTVTKNADCTHDVRNTTTKEKAVSGAVKEWRKTLHGMTESVTDRNQATELTAAGMVVGETRQTRTTDGGLHDNTVTKPTTQAAGKVAHEERKTIFEERAEDRENVAAGGRLPEQSASAAGGGVVEAVSVHLNDDGTADVTKGKSREKAVSGADVTVDAGLYGTTTTTVNENQPNAAPASGLKPGESVKNAKTPGGLWRQVIRTIAVAAGRLIGQSAARDLYTVRSGTVKMQAASAGNSVSGGVGGVVRRVESTLTEMGWRVNEDETRERAVSDAEVSWRVGLHGTTERRTDRNQAAAAEKPGNKEIGKTVTSRKTDGGRYDNTIETTTANDGVEIAAAKEADEFATHESATETKSAKDTGSSFTTGSIMRKQSRRNELGTWDATTQTDTAKQSLVYGPFKISTGAKSKKKTHCSVVFRNYPKGDVNNLAKSYVPSNSDNYTGASVSAHPNQFGLMDGTITWTELPDDDGGGSGKMNISDTKVMDVEYEKIFYFEGKSGKYFYKKTRITQHTRYNENSSWRAEAMQDIANHPGVFRGFLHYESKILGGNSWVYYTEDETQDNSWHYETLKK